MSSLLELGSVTVVVVCVCGREGGRKGLGKVPSSWNTREYYWNTPGIILEYYWNNTGIP